jgi:bifunctional non-homologous end joining protein LigD
MGRHATPQRIPEFRNHSNRATLIHLLRGVREWHFQCRKPAAIGKLGLEGVVSKARDSAYASGRSNNWVKKTCAQRETLTIIGFALDEGKWDGIYLGRRKGGDLIYAGKVDHGFDKASAADLQNRLKPLIRKTQPCAKRIAHKGIWVEPSLLADIEYRAKSAEGKVRQPFFKGLREDQW